MPDRLNLDPVLVVNLRPVANGQVEALLHLSKRDYERLSLDHSGMHYSIAASPRQHHDGPKVPHSVEQASALSRCWRRDENGSICLLPEGHTQEQWETSLITGIIDRRTVHTNRITYSGSTPTGLYDTHQDTT